MDWFPKRWAIGAVLAAGAVGGLFVASAAGGGSAYAGGLVLFAACTLGVFAVIAGAWGPSPLAWIEPLPPNGAVRWAAAGVGAIVAVMGLFHAQAASPGSFAYGEGLALFAVAAGYDFLLLKDWFDRREA